MKGKLYGVGVGPGDPKLLTIQAMCVIQDADVIAVPGKEPQSSVAYQIVQRFYEELEQVNLWKQTNLSEQANRLEEKELLGIEMPMTKDAAVLQQAHEFGTKQICDQLDQGKQIAFLTLGDPCIYSTYLYLHKRIHELGYETEIINGIPSFCAAAARMNMGLTEQAEPLHIYPASYQMDEGWELSGTKVLMKAGKNMKQVKEHLLQCQKNGSLMEVSMVENCGMFDEKIYKTAEEIPDQSGYYSLIIVKGGKEK